MKQNIIKQSLANLEVTLKDAVHKDITCKIQDTHILITVPSLVKASNKNLDFNIDRLKQEYVVLNKHSVKIEVIQTELA